MKPKRMYLITAERTIEKSDWYGPNTMYRSTKISVSLCVSLSGLRALMKQATFFSKGAKRVMNSYIRNWANNSQYNWNRFSKYDEIYFGKWSLVSVGPR